jgi:flagellar biosynthesis/type III secretory pathway chaperone
MRFNQPQQRLDMLIEFLSEQFNIYHHLLDLAKREREALTASKIDALNDVIAEKTHLTHSLDQIEACRIKLMTDLANSFNCNPSVFTLKHLIQWVDQGTAECLLKLRQNLSSVVKKLQKENSINERLITHCIALMGNSINMLNSILYPESTYIHTGYFNKAKEGGFIFSSKI